MIECGGERGKQHVFGRGEGQNNVEDNMTENEEKDVCKAEEEDIEGTDNNNENSAENKTQLN